MNRIKKLLPRILLRSALLMLIALSSSGITWADNLNEIRNEYISALKLSSNADAFYKKLARSDKTDPVILAYYASSFAIRAKFSRNPVTQFTLISKACNILNEAVAKAPQNIEIRFLRFAVEQSLPAFLCKSGHIDEDLQQMVSLIGQKKYQDIAISEKLKAGIIKFLIKSNRCTAAEIALFEKAFSNKAA